MHKKISKKHYCRVCGLYQDEPPWDEEGKSPSHSICACCGVEFGYEDSGVISTKRFRERWIRAGAKWFRPKKKPEVWDIEEQLRNVPEEYL